ncbi:efflux RND transporter periplasmic adaptor subunit [Agrobacterium vitis]|uniref:Efflux RND transporter periplasmic adaptor subunit n=1 Tax=Agrobacterium vitis TaxID=373 RepID=A0AAE5AWY5_AGRVI|nr:efflux RND transporter periplasmic adaptor subunit [Agrobacterium vitis]MCF1500050.1 efflux RND transporter periplasmic adaptor subunit [Allorhizobium sp. Av2]MCM2442265.1 efflux RND transporter periplasmic adaptor subunit [Agrobacterium vitis]MUZ58675.1 efflux RND transporter periplasmic adaptor subunit [Agrobacterium vitis]MVA66310.1 efflux RND transporter periplasmic adaptor subunit [Agrobacterium vitis]MVA88347.1 efflux RND transporter periplasmic adaptor subunit [Agrobacterium vitis]
MVFSKTEQTQTTQSATLTVSVTTPQTLQWADTIAVSGWLAAWQEAIVAAETGSLKITDVLVDVGSVVQKGDVMARLSDASAIADVHKQEAAVASAKAMLAKAKADSARAKKVTGSGALSDQDTLGYYITEQTDAADLASDEASLESSRITLAQTTITAPDSGIVSTRSADLGNVVSAGTELFRLVRQGRVEWQAEVPSYQLPRIHPGAKATIQDQSGKSCEGTVRLVSPIVSDDTGRGTIYVTLPDDPDIRVGLYESGTIELAVTPALTLPETALVYSDGINYVFRVNADSRVTRVRVDIGRRNDGRVEILSGIDAQAQIVEAGGSFLSDNDLVLVKAATK